MGWTSSPGGLGLGPRACRVHQHSRATGARVPGPAVLTSYPWRLSTGSEVLRGRTALRATLARVVGPAGSTSCPGGLATGSDNPRGRKSLPFVSGQCPRAPDVDQLSRATRTGVRGPAVSTSTPGRLALWSMARIVDKLPGSLGPMPEVLRAQPDVPGDLGPCSSACGVEQLSRATRARVRWPAQSTKSHERHVLGSVDSRGRQVLPVDSGSGRGLTGSTSSPGRLGPMPEVLRAQPDVPGDLGPCSSACGNDQLCRATRAWVRGPTGSTSSPG